MCGCADCCLRNDFWRCCHYVRADWSVAILTEMQRRQTRGAKIFCLNCCWHGQSMMIWILSCHFDYDCVNRHSGDLCDVSVSAPFSFARSPFFRSYTGCVRSGGTRSHSSSWCQRIVRRTMPVLGLRSNRQRNRDRLRSNKVLGKSSFHWNKWCLRMTKSRQGSVLD